jgi:hypothetical protein
MEITGIIEKITVRIGVTKAGADWQKQTLSLRN